MLEAWQLLENRLKICREQNEQNGKMIARSQRTVQHLLDIVRGNPLKSENLYTAKGMRKPSGAGITVAKA